ncbi:endo-1,4-beta-xylanase [Leptolyngbya boryana CZ1]|uniref:Beta-xylanase n=1 Tax=Leptolyngbya boryana CZ1 TaxID=3060204 RepID=A0AA97ARN6_LEPBY|nr:endo-1,4-beta-xylanase [Leptolyngbya boryana]WNZ47632.1 endo-1,4-beta-xylanase [Leptolyngbya boryana CZ1]
MLHPCGMNRRTFLAGLGTLTAASVVGCSSNETDNILADTAMLKEIQAREFPASQTRSLHERAKDKGLFFGAFTDYRTFRKDPKIREAFKRDCGLVVGGVFWHITRPEAEQFDWSMPDVFFNFAQENNMMFRGHPLVWHKLYPKWMRAKLDDPTTSRKDIEDLLEKHISTVVGHYAGKAHSWDVVNEAIKPENGRPDGLRSTPWLRYLGPDYIDFAFRVAAQADPKAMLVLNDYGVEYRDSHEERRRTSLLKLLEQLKAKGTPIQGLGVQAHLTGNRSRAAFKPLRKFLSNVADLGLKIIITELDVQDKRLPANRDFRDRLIASAYSDFLGIALDEKAVIGVITWGLSDRYTWLTDYAPRSDQLPLRPLPLDDQMQRKFAWNAIARAFDEAPSR